MREVFREKEEKYASLTPQQREKRMRENQEAVERLIKMIVSNALISSIFKIPNAVVSLNDLRIIISQHIDKITAANQSAFYFNFPYSMAYLCIYDRICSNFQSFGDFLFLTYLSLLIYFYLKFDRKFKTLFYFMFNIKVNKSNNK